jgi:hypothetical protein
MKRAELDGFSTGEAFLIGVGLAAAFSFDAVPFRTVSLGAEPDDFLSPVEGGRFTV